MGNLLCKIGWHKWWATPNHAFFKDKAVLRSYDRCLRCQKWGKNHYIKETRPVSFKGKFEDLNDLVEWFGKLPQRPDVIYMPQSAFNTLADFIGKGRNMMYFKGVIVTIEPETKADILPKNIDKILAHA